MNNIFNYIKCHKRVLLCIIALLIIVFFIFSSSHKTKVNSAPLVQAVSVIERSVPVNLIAIGSVESRQSVTIIPQVTGIITGIHFRPGQRVTRGQTLFTIQSDTFNAALQQAEATLERDQAQLVYLQADAKRYASLVKLEYVTRDQYEQSQAAANAQMALVKADQAQVKQAQIQLGYTTIRSPVAGKAGNYTVRVGDLVVENGTPLLTINQLDSVYVDFSVPTRELQDIRYYQHWKQEHLSVDIFSEDNKTKIATGSLSFIDNAVDPKTGTVLLKAAVENPNYTLWPGQMVNVVMTLKVDHDALVIPLSAVQFDQQGSFVYLYKDNKAVIQRVDVGKQTGSLAVIDKGLSKGEMVLTTIPPNLDDGAPVQLADNRSESTS